MKIRIYHLLLALLALSIVLSACGSKEAETPTPTPVDANAIAIQAIQTFSMGLTMTAFAQPTATWTPIPTATSQPTFAIFGSPSPAAAPTSSCEGMVWVQDITIPDGTVMAPSQAFVKKWEVKNTGTCTWTPTYKIAFGWGNPMGGQATAIGKTVPPGGTIIVEVNMVAPNSAGDASGNWRMQNDKGEYFGIVTVVIKVAGPTSTASAEPTETPTATP